MVFLLRFLKIYISKSTVYYNLHEGINNAVNFSKTQKTYKFLTQFDFAKLISFDRSANSGICQKLQNLTRTDEQIVVAVSHFEAMKSLSKKILGAVFKIKKKKKLSRRKRASKKPKISLSDTAERIAINKQEAAERVMKASSDECSQFSITLLDSDIAVPECASSKESSSSRTMASSYRDALMNEDTSVLSAAENDSLKEFLKNTRYEVYTPYGKWINESWLDARATQGIRIKVLSYNILGQILLEMHPYLYSNHDKKYLTWEYRSRALVQEFAEFDADILCLQEVEDSKLTFFDAALALRGYSKGIFKKRTRSFRDGCAIYYRKNKFELKEIVPLEYYQPSVSALDRDNIGLIVRLAPTEAPDKNIVVATTHLLFNPRRHDVRLAQIQLMLAEIERVAFKNTVQGRDIYHPIILTGDFNARPFSPVFALLRDGQMKLDHPDPLPPWLGISTQCQHYEVKRNRGLESREESDIKRVQLFNTERTSPPLEPHQSQERPRRIRDQSDYLSHRLNLNSVYTHRTSGKKEDATTFHDDWCTVDYMFYGPVRFTCNGSVDGDLKLLSYLRLPNIREAESMERIPNEVCASDHFPLLATFHLPTSTLSR